MRGFAQKNPKQEYKREAFEMFQGLTNGIKTEVMQRLSKLRLQVAEDVDALEEQRRRTGSGSMEAIHEEAAPAAAGAEAPDAPLPQGVPASMPAGPAPGARAPRPMRSPPAATGAPETFVRTGRKVGRNEPCPCGSGKKFKQCHGRVAH